MPRLMILPFAIIVGLLLASCGGSGATPTSTLTPTPIATATPSAIDAGALYAAQCSMCHQANREGISGLGPALTPESLAALSDTEINDTISNGKPGTPMQGFKGRLSAEEIDALMNFLKYTSP